MKKYLFAVPVLILAMTFVHAQGIREGEGQDAGGSVLPLDAADAADAAVKILAESLNAKLIEEKAGKIAVGQFAYRGNAVPLGAYWVNQLAGELANIPGRPYLIVLGGPAGADWAVSGEIVETPFTGNIRLYTRLVRAADRAIEASFHFDFERNGQIAGMLSSEESRGGRSSSVSMDDLEPDSFDNPVPHEIGANDGAQVVNRTLHSGDEDFFLLLPESDGQLTAETTGSVDTFMELYNADTREKLRENDDGGSNSNARIRHSVEAGKRYIAKVRGYGSSDTGAYGFRAYLSVRMSSNGFDNPLSYEIGVDENAPVMNRALERDNDDFFLLLPGNDGRLVTETTGSVDTFMEFYDADTREKLTENDDGGRGSNARIRYNVQAGKRYIAKVRGYESGDAGAYGFRAWLQVQAVLAPDEYEPDNDSASAKSIEIGKPQQHTFHTANDVDWVKFQVTQPGRYVIRARGVNSNRLDTCIELFDSNLNSIGEDDDGGENLDSRLSLRLQSGLYYLKVECLDEEADQPYAVSVEAE